MDILSIFAVATALAMDAFAVAVAAGIRLGCAVTAGHVFRLAASFGLFQFGMTVAGWGSGVWLARYIQAFDHWIALGLLLIIGGKMIYESVHDDGAPRNDCDPTTGWTLFMLSVATSIDAFAVGLSLGVLESGIWLESIVIGLVAAVFTMTGLRLGNVVGMRFSHRIEAVGGIILILIGIRIAVVHVTGGI